MMAVPSKAIHESWYAVNGYEWRLNKQCDVEKGVRGVIYNICVFFFYRRLEKEQRQKEKEAKKIEEKATKRQEKEAAKLEKMYRNTISSRSQISRSSERVGSRSGSLERRRSGDGEMVVLNQSTVHGNFSNASVPLLHGYFKMFSRVHRSRTVCVIFSTFFKTW